MVSQELLLIKKYVRLSGKPYLWDGCQERLDCYHILTLDGTF